MTAFEKVLLDNLKAVSGVDVEAILKEYACNGDCACRQPDRAKADVVDAEVVPPKAIETVAAPSAPTAASAKEVVAAADKVIESQRQKPAEQGVNLTGLFNGSGDGKTLNKDVFLKAVADAGSIAVLKTINAVCECGYTDATWAKIESLPAKQAMDNARRKLNLWAEAQ